MKNIFLLFLGLSFCTGCVALEEMSALPREGKWRDFRSDFKSLYTLDRGRNIVVDGRELTAGESFQLTMDNQFINGHISNGEYNNFMKSYYHLERRRYNDPHFYLRNGRIQRVPERNTLDWWEYQRHLGNTP